MGIETELNGLAIPDTTSLTGINKIGQVPNTNQERPQKLTGPCFGCGHPGNLLRNCRKKTATNDCKKTDGSTITTPCETCGKISHEAKDCYSVGNWANCPTWWKTKRNNSTSSQTMTQRKKKKNLERKKRAGKKALGNDSPEMPVKESNNKKTNTGIDTIVFQTEIIRRTECKEQNNDPP